MYYFFPQVDHLLGGDYPVNASELSILKIILEWLEIAQGIIIHTLRKAVFGYFGTHFIMF